MTKEEMIDTYRKLTNQIIEKNQRLLSHISTLEEKVKELESDLKLNASMLAKQCDLAREAENERDHLSKLLIKESMKVVELRNKIHKTRKEVYLSI